MTTGRIDLAPTLSLDELEEHIEAADESMEYYDIIGPLNRQGHALRGQLSTESVRCHWLRGKLFAKAARTPSAIGGIFAREASLNAAQEAFCVTASMITKLVVHGRYDSSAELELLLNLQHGCLVENTAMARLRVA